MFFEQLMFFIAAFGALGGALGVVLLRNPFYSVLALVAHLLALAVLFLLLRAEFLAAAQVVVYAGAVMVLYLFVVAYVGGVDEPLGGGAEVARRLGPLFAGVLLVEISIAVIGSGLNALGSQGADVPLRYGTPGQIGQLLLERFLIAFEGASFLLLVAAVGAVVLARRRRGLEETPGPATARLGSRPDSDDPATAGAGSAEGSDPAEERAPAKGPGAKTPARQRA